jgi:hypothetical protein
MEKAYAAVKVLKVKSFMMERSSWVKVAGKERSGRREVDNLFREIFFFIGEIFLCASGRKRAAAAGKKVIIVVGYFVQIF